MNDALIKNLTGMVMWSVSGFIFTWVICRGVDFIKRRIRLKIRDAKYEIIREFEERMLQQATEGKVPVIVTDAQQRRKWVCPVCLGDLKVRQDHYLTNQSPMTRECRYCDGGALQLVPPPPPKPPAHLNPGM